MLTFVRTESMRAQAAEGAHDDCVMALAIAFYCRMQQRTTQIGAERVSWTQDMLEDYERSDTQTKKELLLRWGNPF